MEFNRLHADVEIELDMFEGESKEHALERMRKILRQANKLDTDFSVGYLSNPRIFKCETLEDVKIGKSCIRF